MRRNLEFALCALAACALIFGGCAEDEASTDTAPVEATGDASADSSDIGSGSSDSNTSSGEDTASSETSTAPPSAEPLVCDDSEPLPASAIGENGIGPGTRITSIEIPDSTARAAELGCRTVGTNNGTGLGGVLSLVQGQGGFDGLDSLLMAMNGEEPDLILLGQMSGWVADETASTAGAELHMYTGTMDEAGEFSIDPASLTNGDINAPLIAFEADTTSGCLIADAPLFDVTIPIEGIGELALSLSAARAEGSLVVNADGFGIEGGTITGYLTTGAVGDLVENILNICNGPGAPSFCTTVQGLLMDDVALGTEVILGFLGNADSTVDAENNVSGGCDEDALPDGSSCAVSICLAVSSTPTKIAGVSE